jgi:hypothetical protein
LRVLASIPGWMPPRSDPCTSNHDRDDMVQLYGHHRGTTTGRAPKNARAVLTPLKVPGPPLTPGIEEANSSPMQRITGSHLRALETVAHAAGQPEVGLLITPTACLGNNMVDF